MNRFAPASQDPRYRLAPISGPTVQEDSRTVSFIFSDESVDRYGDTIKASGWQLANYKANPVALFGHDAGTVENVIGRAKNVRVEGSRLIGDIEFMGAEVNPNAEAVFKMVAGGFLKSVSVGFQPIEWQRSSDKSRPGGIDFKKVELLEISIVPIPANANAVAQAKAAGIDISRLGFATGSTSGPAASGRHQTPKQQDDLMTLRRAAGAPKFSAGASDLGEAQRRERAAARAAGIESAFPSFGHFLRAVAGASAGLPDRRLVRAPTGAGEVDPTGGGFAVPVEYLEGLLGSIFEESVLAGLVDHRQTDRPAKAVLPSVAETSRADGSRQGGVTSYWVNEGDLAPTSFAKFRMLEFAAHKLIALCVASEELIADVPMLESHVRRVFAAEGAFRLDYSILRGTGAGMPLGIIGAPGTIVVPKVNGQAAATILPDNITAMWSRLALPCRRRAVWIVNGEADGQIDTFGATPGTAGMYFPAGANGNPFPLLKGRPVLFAEQSPTLGTPGDIVLADLSQYVLVDGGMKTALSMDCRWNTDEGIWRFTLRVDGKPNISAPVAPYNGGATQSAFVTLAAR